MPIVGVIILTITLIIAWFGLRHVIKAKHDHTDWDK